MASLRSIVSALCVVVLVAVSLVVVVVDLTFTETEQVWKRESEQIYTTSDANTKPLAREEDQSVAC